MLWVFRVALMSAVVGFAPLITGFDTRPSPA